MVKYHRVLLKLSGEMLEGGTTPLAPENLLGLAQEIKAAYQLKTQIGIVIGGGNILRGAASTIGSRNRPLADRSGMLATVINSLMLADTLRAVNIPVVVQSALGASSHEEAIDPAKALEALTHGAVVIFAGGTGNPYFSTDTAAALRALEIKAEVLLKGTKVEGLYTKDPQRYPDAQFIPKIDYLSVIERQLAVMDLTAMTLCREHALPIIVFNLKNQHTLARLLCGESLGTLVDGGTHYAQGNL